MNITEEKIADLNTLLKIKLQPEDYNEQYNKALNDYRKKANMPGFRVGKVPMGVIKNRYGKSLLAEELNKVLNNAIQNHITENKLQVLGSPIPSDKHEDIGDWNNPSDFEFFYEVGVSPEINVQIDEKSEFDYYKVKVDDELLDKQITDIARRYGKLQNVEVSGEKDMLIGDFVELDENDEIKAGGIMNNSTISIEFVEDTETTNKLTGLKVGDKVVVDPFKVSKGHDDLARMLGVSHEEVHHITTNFQFNIKEVKHMSPAEVNQDLFDKVYGEGNVQDEEEFRGKIKDELNRMFGSDSDRMFKRDISNKLIQQAALQLPDDFLKRWIQMTNEKPVTMEQIEEDYEQYRKSLEWQLIFNKLITDKTIQVETSDVVERTKQLLGEQYAQYGIPAPEDKELEESAKKVLTNQDEARKIYDMIYDEKLIEHVRNTAKVNEHEVDYDKFAELASKG